ncbi:MAG: hypothetical protein AB7L91_08530 [Dehalococcoidia bacterium]
MAKVNRDAILLELVVMKIAEHFPDLRQRFNDDVPEDALDTMISTILKQLDAEHLRAATSARLASAPGRPSTR